MSGSPPGAPPIVVVQARMSSSRRRGKALASVGGEPMLALQLRRLARAPDLGEVVVATSTGAEDDAIAKAAAALGVRVRRGALEDVLTRFLDAIGGHDGPVVRLAADRPLVDPDLVRAVVARFDATPGCGYASNCHPRRFPAGLEVEVCAASALRAIADETIQPYDREHVTSALQRQPERFRHASVACPEDLSALRWTVDVDDDLAFMRLLVDRLGERRYDAGWREVLAVVRREPSLAGFRGRRG